jgi:hypothetical protein
MVLQWPWWKPEEVGRDDPTDATLQVGLKLLHGSICKPGGIQKVKDRPPTGLTGPECL